MTKDIFYATLKLVTGEELISIVCAFIEDGEVLIVLDNPIIATLMEIRNMKVPIIKVLPWLTTTSNTTYIINRKHIISMNEIKDESIIKVHQQYVRDKNSITNQTQITSGMGYVSTIQEARKSLEKIYNSQEDHRKVE